jgi:hypothetical protein
LHSHQYWLAAPRGTPGSRLFNKDIALRTLGWGLFIHVHLTDVMNIPRVGYPGAANPAVSDYLASLKRAFLNKSREVPAGRRLHPSHSDSAYDCSKTFDSQNARGFLATTARMALR